MFNVSIIGSGLNTLLILLIDILIFYIIYSTLSRGFRYLENVLIYTVCMEIQLMIVTRYISLTMFFLLFGTYFVIGLIMIFILSKLYNYRDWGKPSFIAISILIQFAVSLLSNLLLSLFIKIFY